jgi:hypothetical protein
MEGPEPKSILHPGSWKAKRNGYTFIDRQYDRWG